MQNVVIHWCGESQYYSILLYDTFPPITCVLSTRSKTHLMWIPPPPTLLHFTVKNKVFSYNIWICGGQLVISLNCSQSKWIFHQHCQRIVILWWWLLEYPFKVFGSLLPFIWIKQTVISHLGSTNRSSLAINYSIHNDKR